MLDRYSRKNGVTLVELLIVIAIMATLTAIAALSTNFMRRERLASSAKEILSNIQGARFQATATGPAGAAPNKRGVGIRFASANSYVVFDFNDILPAPLIPAPGAGGNYKYDSVAEEANTRPITPSSGQLRILIGGVLVAPTNNAATNIVIFDKTGFPRDANWQVIPTLTMAITDPNLPSYIPCINIMTNSIRKGFWNVAAAACNVQ